MTIQHSSRFRGLVCRSVIPALCLAAFASSAVAQSVGENALRGAAGGAVIGAIAGDAGKGAAAGALFGALKRR